MKKYGSVYGLKNPHHAKLSKIIKAFCQENNIIYGEKDVFQYVWNFPPKEKQLSLFDDV